MGFQFDETNCCEYFKHVYNTNEEDLKQEE
jgi:hypothetical protein